MKTPMSAAPKNMDPLAENFLEAAENIVANASSRVAQGKFVEIGKLIPLPNQAPVLIQDVNNMCTLRKEAENIAPVQRHKDSLLCDKCGALFKTTHNLKMHKMRHEGLKAFACTSCDQRFVNQYLLKVHVRVRHLGETPYACKFCERKFFTSTSRSYHQRTQHIRDWSYECNLCSLRFNTRTDLNKHKYRHTGQKPFRCEVCNMSFPRRSDLKNHYNTQSHYKKVSNRA
ncbi:myoneurin [Drosophila serrata]|uniref:myoneurin n=1 Tax=Drosophila serrata TaxID=7274 RepID=UPI000A1D1F34|nr:myoneurin [Drosophila serrata]XP_020799621.1 myoneurin [Drosophila serrata]